MNQKEICRIIGMTRAKNPEWREVLKFINRKRGAKYESFTATDGRCLSRLVREIPPPEANDALLYESALLDGRGSLAKRQDLPFPRAEAVFPESGGEETSVVSVSWLLRRLRNARLLHDVLLLETGGVFYAEAHHEAFLLNPRYVKIMATQVQALQRYGFSDKVSISVWKKNEKGYPPVLFSAASEEKKMSYSFLVTPMEYFKIFGHAGADVKIN